MTPASTQLGAGRPGEHGAGAGVSAWTPGSRRPELPAGAQCVAGTSGAHGAAGPRAGDTEGESQRWQRGGEGREQTGSRLTGPLQFTPDLYHTWHVLSRMTSTHTELHALLAIPREDTTATLCFVVFLVYFSSVPPSWPPPSSSVVSMKTFETSHGKVMTSHPELDYSIT